MKTGSSLASSPTESQCLQEPLLCLPSWLSVRCFLAHKDTRCMTAPAAAPAAQSSAPGKGEQATTCVACAPFQGSGQLSLCHLYQRVSWIAFCKVRERNNNLMIKNSIYSTCLNNVRKIGQKILKCQIKFQIKIKHPHKSQWKVDKVKMR